MGTVASIDIAAMSGLVTAAGSAGSAVAATGSKLAGVLAGVDVSCSGPGQLTSVSGWLSSEVPGLRRRLSLAQAIEAAHPSAALTVSIDERLVSKMGSGAAVALGRADAHKLTGAGNHVNAALLASIAAHAEDPYYASGFARTASAAQLSQVVLTASRSRERLGTDVATQRAWARGYGALLATVSAALGTATRSTGVMAMPPDYAKAWANTITAKDGAIGQGAAASVLLRQGNYSSAFINGVATSVYNYERNNSGDGPLWRSRSLDGGKFKGPYLPNGAQISDPLANIMTALGNNPVAAQTFFDVGNPLAKQAAITVHGDGKVVNDRLKYLLADRIWKLDLGSDNFAGLHRALNAAIHLAPSSRAGDENSSTISRQVGWIGASDKGEGFLHHIGRFAGDLAGAGWGVVEGIGKLGEILDPVSGVIEYGFDGELDKLGNIVKKIGEFGNTLNPLTGIATYGAKGELDRLAGIGKGLIVYDKWGTDKTGALADTLVNIGSLAIGTKGIGGAAKGARAAAVAPKVSAVGGAVDLTTRGAVAAGAATRTSASAAELSGTTEAPGRFSTNKMLSKYDHETIAGHPLNPFKEEAVHYFSDEERALHRVIVSDGKLVWAHSGKPFDTSDGMPTPLRSGARYDFAMDGQGKIYSSSFSQHGRVQHSTFLAGKPAAAAGELAVKDGELKAISMNTGHYKTTAAQRDALLRWLEGQGIDTSHVFRDAF